MPRQFWSAEQMPRSRYRGMGAYTPPCDTAAKLAALGQPAERVSYEYWAAQCRAAGGTPPAFGTPYKARGTAMTPAEVKAWSVALGVSPDGSTLSPPLPAPPSPAGGWWGSRSTGEKVAIGLGVAAAALGVLLMTSESLNKGK